VTSASASPAGAIPRGAGPFYPRRWPQARELEYASRRVGSVEINGSFYSLQHPDSYRAWRDATPDNFVFAVKGGRFITHMKRLADVERPWPTSSHSGVLRLGPKLGPILWQLPPSFRFDPKRLAAFFRLLPATRWPPPHSPAAMDRRVTGRAWMRTDARRPLRHALEVRQSRSWTLASSSSCGGGASPWSWPTPAGTWPAMEDVTADFVYVRCTDGHGPSCT
jgi:uncharacterized protein YecE (DUF72 family)